MEEQQRSNVPPKGLVSSISDPALATDLLNYSSVGVFILDREFKVIWINKAVEEYFGLRREAVLGQDKRKLVQTQVNQIFADPQAFAERVLATYADNTYVERFECRVLPGEERQGRWLEHWSQPIHSGAYAGGRIEHYTDITARKQAEAERERLVRELAAERAQLEKRVRSRTRQVRALAAKLSLAEHQERERISHLLHDHVQQMLYAVQMRTHLLELAISSHRDDFVLQQLQEMKQLTDEAIQASRTLTVDLSPPVLENEGLPEALMWLATQMREVYGLRVTINSNGRYQKRSKGLSVLLFQFVRELLFNVIKHAQTDAAIVSLYQMRDRLSISVLDRGRGFDVNHLPQSEDVQTGFGLYSIRERLTLFGGEIKINSTPGVGTEVTVSLPMSQIQDAG